MKDKCIAIQKQIFMKKKRVETLRILETYYGMVLASPNTSHTRVLELDFKA